MKPLHALIISLICMLPVEGRDRTIRFDNFENYPGAPFQAITSLTQDGTGFLWMTTDNDLIRFDGVEFVSFRNRAPDLARNLGVIQPLFSDSGGRLWIASRNGVYLYNDTLDTFIHYEVPLTPASTILSPVIHKIAEDPGSKKIFFLSEDGVIYNMANGSLVAVLDLPVQGSKFMTIDNEQNIWVSGNHIIFRYNIASNYTSSFVLEEGFINGREIRDMLVVDSVLYIAALKSEIIRYEPATGEKTHITVNTITPNYYCFLKEHDGNIWIGSATGLYFYNISTGTFDIYKSEYRNIKSLSSNSVFSTFRDRQGNMWLGTEKGLNVAYADQQFEVFGYSFGSPVRSENVNSIKRDSQGNLWIGYAVGGIDIFDSEYRLIRSLDRFDGLNPVPEISQVFTIHEDSDGDVWFGTYMHGLLRYRLSTGEIKQFFPDGSKGAIQGSDVRSISSDRDGNLWLAVHGAGPVFFERETQSFTLLHDKYDGFTFIDGNIWTFKTLTDSHGNLWVGSSMGAEYFDFSTGQSIQYNTDNPEDSRITDNIVKQIMEDSHGRVWLGTNNGLNVIEGNSITRLTVYHGLPSDQISSIIEDNKGRIWVSTIRGLSRLTCRSSGIYEVKNFNKHDGLYIDYFTDNSGFLCQERLYFGGIDGFIIFDPDHITKKNEPFPLVFTFFQLFNKTIRPHTGTLNRISGDDKFTLGKSLQYLDQITLKEKQNLFGISFAALNLTRAVNNQYTYMLEGFDKEWIRAGSRNTAVYSNLKPGTYTFKVMAAIDDGTWGHDTLSMTVKIVPPFWKSYFAVAVYFLVIILIVFLIINFAWERERIKLQIQQKDILDNMKTQFFINISHELKTPLTLISSPMKHILEKNAGNRTINIDQEDMKSIYRNVLRLLRIFMQILDFRKIELGKIDFRVSRNDIVPFIDSIVHYFDYLARDKQVDIVLKYDQGKDLSFYFDPDKMDKIIYNVLSNALKHSPPGSSVYINVTADMEGKSGLIPGKGNCPCIRIDIDDCGTGIDKNRLGQIFEQFSSNRLPAGYESDSTGIGLSIVREFTELHKGTVRILSPYHDESGRQISGTRVILLFPSSDIIADMNYITDDNSRYNEIILENRLTVVDNLHDDEEEAEMNEGLSNGYKILIIEDDPELREMLKRR
jgi:ligand-binding sensor domain-containing protein/signal transduction histidine kinase